MNIKIIQFRHNNRYYCVCRAICLLSKSDVNFQEALNRIIKTFQIYLRDKDFFRLKKIGWKVTENSAKPPIFADEELVRTFNKQVQN